MSIRLSVAVTVAPHASLQDYFYVRGFAPFAGACLASCPDKHVEVLVGGISALVDEMAWFKDTCAKRGIDLANTGEWVLGEGKGRGGPCHGLHRLGTGYMS